VIARDAENAVHTGFTRQIVGGLHSVAGAPPTSHAAVPGEAKGEA
jgi:hypothetical protein